MSQKNIDKPILCIEDDEGIQTLIKKKLRKEGYAIDTASTYSEGLRMTKEKIYAIILIDYHLPDGEGVEILKTLRSNHEETCFVMLTGMGSEEIIINAFHSGADYFLNKDSDLKFLDLLPSILRQCVEKVQLIKEKKQYVEQLKINMEAAVKENVKKDNFLSTMTHELKTPLYTISGYCECLMEEIYGPLNAKQIEVLSKVQKASLFLNSIVSDLITMIMLERDRVKLDVSTFKLFDTVEFCIDMVKEKARQKGIDIVLNYHLDQEFELKGDPDKIKQMLINLISNAIKYSEKGTITVTVNESEFLNISVQDEGIGIDEESQKIIFEPYIQIPSIKGKKGEGSGLGLAITKKLVELHDGKIAIESQLNKGTRVHVQLPCKSTQRLNC